MRRLNIFKGIFLEIKNIKVDIVKNLVEYLDNITFLREKFSNVIFIRK